MTKRIVAAADPLTSGTSMVGLVKGNPIPVIGYREAPLVPKGAKPTLAETVERISTQVEVLVKRIAANEPELVVLPRLFVGSVQHDPSGGRRAALYWSLVAALTDARIPTADFPLLTLERYTGCVAKPGYNAISALNKRAQEIWVGAPRNVNDRFRWSTIPLAAVGCAAVGIPTALPITPVRLRMLKGGTWPDSVKLATSVHEWKARYGATRLGGRKAAEADDTADEAEADAESEAVTA